MLRCYSLTKDLFKLLLLLKVGVGACICVVRVCMGEGRVVEINCQNGQHRIENTKKDTKVTQKKSQRKI